MVVAVKLTPYQACRSTEGWFPIKVASSSGTGFYKVLVSPWDPRENICECMGYVMRLSCRHQAEASSRVCRWTELTDPQQQTPEERKSKICPRCEGPTRWEVEVVEDEAA